MLIHRFFLTRFVLNDKGIKRFSNVFNGFLIYLGEWLIYDFSLLILVEEEKFRILISQK
jgi:hypothetical protein